MKRLFNALGERLNKISSLKLTFLAVLSALVVGALSSLCPISTTFEMATSSARYPRLEARIGRSS
jgi:hypothetical protein